MGKDIAHSLSPQIYRSHLGERLHYKLLDYKNSHDIPQLSTLMDGLNGLSITAPYKEHFLDAVNLSSEIKALGAINCIYRDEVGELWGENTDYLAMLELTELQLAQNQYTQVIILGAGAMARVTAAALKAQGLDYQQYSRQEHGPLENYSFTREFKGPIALINCCSRGFFYQGEAPCGSLYWDLNYAQPQAQEIIKKLGYTYLDGEPLLKLQARYALQMWRLLPY